jgi:signal transduction histidine kinase
VAADLRLEAAIAGLVKLALNARLFALLFTVLWLPSTSPTEFGTVTGLLAVVAATSVVPILLWDRLAPWVLAHPAVLLVDLAVASAVLALVGLETPFGLFVLSTALVAGVLYSWTGAVVMSIALVAAYGVGAVLAQAPPTMAEVLGTPALVPIVAVGGAAIRRVVVEQHTAAAELAEAVLTTATATERTRLAREMHDTLAKTLHGIALSATAVPRLLDHDPRAAALTANGLAETASQAAEQARDLLVDLRNDDLDRPLDAVLATAVRTWSARTGIAVDLDVDACDGVAPSVRYELLCILREALHNAHRHAQAERVCVRLRDGDPVELTVADDGRGFDAPSDLAALSSEGHFGLIGMGERADAIGGSLRVETAPRAGVRIHVRAPRNPSHGHDPLTPLLRGSQLGANGEAAG